MTMQYNNETIISNMLSIAIDAFKTKKKEIANDILMALIVNIRNNDDDLQEKFLDIQENSYIISEINLEDFYDFMIPFQDKLEVLLKISSSYKSKSDIFMQLYKAIDKLYSTVIVLTNEVAFIESELKIEEEIAS